MTSTLTQIKEALESGDISAPTPKAHAEWVTALNRAEEVLTLVDAFCIDVAVASLEADPNWQARAEEHDHADENAPRKHLREDD